MKKITTLIFLLSVLITHSQIRLDSIINSENTVKILYLYNSENLITNSEMYEMNSDGVSWDKKEIISMTYNSDNLVNTEIYSYWNGTEFINNEKVENTYNSDFNIETKILSNWNSTSSTWEYNYTRNFNYSTGILSEIIDYDNIDNIYHHKFSYNYNVDDTINNITKFNRNNDNTDWEDFPWTKKEYSYDNNLISEIEYSDLDRDGNFEVINTRTDYEYINVTDDLILPPFHFNDSDLLLYKIENKVNTADFFTWSNSNWVNDGSLEYFYSDTTLSTLENEIIFFRFYPNPTTNQVKFEVNKFDSIEIYSLNGKLITKTENNIVDMKGLPNGIYLYRIHKGNEVINGKIIKK